MYIPVRARVTRYNRMVYCITSRTNEFQTGITKWKGSRNFTLIATCVGLSVDKGLQIEQARLMCICSALTTSVAYNVLMCMAFFHVCLSVAAIVHMLPISHLNTSHQRFLCLLKVLVPVLGSHTVHESLHHLDRMTSPAHLDIGSYCPFCG